MEKKNYPSMDERIEDFKNSQKEFVEFNESGIISKGILNQEGIEYIINQYNKLKHLKEIGAEVISILETDKGTLYGYSIPEKGGR